MCAKAIRAAAMLCALSSIWQPALAQQHRKVAQNVQYVICMPKPGNAGSCLVQEPVDPCPASSAEAYPKKKYATVREACAEARKSDACRGSLSGC